MNTGESNIIDLTGANQEESPYSVHSFAIIFQQSHNDDDDYNAEYIELLTQTRSQINNSPISFDDDLDSEDNEIISRFISLIPGDGRRPNQQELNVLRSNSNTNTNTNLNYNNINNNNNNVNINLNFIWNSETDDETDDDNLDYDENMDYDKLIMQKTKPKLTTKMFNKCEINNAYECSICLEEYNLHNMLTFGCNHKFCKDCVSNLFESSIINLPHQTFYRCPNCRKDVKKVAVNYSRAQAKSKKELFQKSTIVSNMSQYCCF